jgi:hypothetical protein
MKSVILATCILAIAGVAEASPCSEKVAALQARFQAEHPSGAAAPGTEADAPESTAAKLHRQPTEASVANAESKADSSAEQRSAHFQIEIEQAQAAADSGDEAECEKSAAEAQRALAP